MKKYLLLLLPVLINQCKPEPKAYFKTKDPNKTGVRFSNNITYGDSLSVIDFEYMYNGGGVAAVDINNDGWQDLFFVGNMTSSKLYLNKGNWQFEDITDKANVTTSTWASGVAIADVNQDGFKDIYLSVGGDRYTPREKRNNLLFAKSFFRKQCFHDFAIHWRSGYE